MPAFTPAIDKFNESYLPEPNSGCWIWTLALNSHGYGLLQCGGFKGYAHRFSYLNFRGPIPDGQFVCHRCDSRWCVNPDHLFVGSVGDNNRDCSAKGRHNSRNPLTNYARGERQHLAKVGADEVRKIRALKGKLSHRKIGEAFGITGNNVKFILDRKTWAHVGD